MRSEHPDDWTAARLGEHAEVVVGFPFKSAEFTDDPNGIRLLRGDNVGQGRLRWNGARKLPAARISDFERYTVKPRDIVLAMDRPWIDAGLKYAMVRREDTPCLLVQRVARLRGTDELAQRYLQYVIASPEFTRWVQAVQTGTAVPHISGGQIADYPISLPPQHEQERITSVLGVLDDKIDSNRRLAALLEETAAAIFKARFVDFLGMEELEQRGTARMPKGWEVGALNDLGRFVNGKAFTKEANGRGRPIVRIRELNSGIDDGTLRSDIEASGDLIASADDILFAWSGSLGLYRWPGPESLINQHIFKVIPEDWPAWFVYGWIREHMPEFRAIAQDKATTMGHIQRRHLAEAVVPIPDGETIAAADDVVKWLDEHRRALVNESSTLCEIRDSLLPKLISGEIRVPDTTDPEEVIGPAADQLVERAR